MNTQQEQPNIATLQTIDISKQNLLDYIKKNKEKHDQLYNIALEGYRSGVYTYTEKLKTVCGEYSELYSEHKKVVDSRFEEWDKNGPFSCQKTPNQSIAVPTEPVFPVNKSSEYEAAIKKVELSIHDTFRLSESEFQQFIMNNWSWRAQFVNSVTSNCYPSLYCSGITTGVYIGATVSGALSQF